MNKITYSTRGTCSRRIEVEIEDNIIKHVEFQSGCDGNLQGISMLVEGMEIEEVIKRLKGIDCGGRGTSCPDQLAIALLEHTS